MYAAKNGRKLTESLSKIEKSDIFPIVTQILIQFSTIFPFNDTKTGLENYLKILSLFQ